MADSARTQTSQDQVATGRDEKENEREDEMRNRDEAGKTAMRRQEEKTRMRQEQNVNQ